MKPSIRQRIQVEEIRAERAEIWKECHDIGMLRIFASWLLEPPNPFDPKRRRRPRGEMLILASYLGLMFLVFVLFNWS